LVINIQSIHDARSEKHQVKLRHVIRGSEDVMSLGARSNRRNNSSSGYFLITSRIKHGSSSCGPLGYIMQPPSSICE